MTRTVETEVKIGKFRLSLGKTDAKLISGHDE